MTLSQTAEHALRAVLFLARQPEGIRVPAEVIAEALAAPRNYLSKTLGTLAKEGVITSARGPSGGFRLGVPAAQLSVARVVGAFDDPSESGACLVGGRSCSAASPCAAHARWKALRAASMAPLETTMIADLLGEAASAGARSMAGA